MDAILMASGFSRRFGSENKLLQPFAGRPLAQHTLELICGHPEIGRVFFVAADPQVLALARPFPVESILNQNPERGQCESIRLGVLSSLAEEYLFCTCDQPMLDRPTLQQILDRRDGYHILYPHYGEKKGSPTLFPAAFQKELLALDDGQGGRAVMAAHPRRVQPVEVANPLALEDVDCPEDLIRLSKGHL